MKEIALTIPGDTTGYDFGSPVKGMPVGSDKSVSNLIQWGITSLFIIAGLLALAFLIIGGIQWIMSGGDKTAVESARKKITWALVGLVITFSAYLIMNVLSAFLGINILSPRCGLNQHMQNSVCVNNK